MIPYHLGRCFTDNENWISKINGQPNQDEIDTINKTYENLDDVLTNNEERINFIKFNITSKSTQNCQMWKLLKIMILMILIFQMCNPSKQTLMFISLNFMRWINLQN